MQKKKKQRWRNENKRKRNKNQLSPTKRQYKCSCVLPSLSAAASRPFLIVEVWVIRVRVSIVKIQPQLKLFVS